MNQKKSLKLLIILIIIVLLIILIGAFFIVCLSTDIFKSDKELFFKYITQIGDSENGFIDNNLKQYFERKKTTPYINEGSFSTNIDLGEIQQQLDQVNNFNISFSGQVDTANSKSAQNISLNYSDSVKFPINYRQVGNVIGLQTKYVGKKFIAVETDKLDNITGSTDNYLEYVDKSQEIFGIKLTDEEKSNILNTYINVLNTNLNNKKFSKVEDSGMNGYKLSLTGEELKNIIVQLLKTLENDQTTLEKMNEYIKIYNNSSKLTVNNIENTINSISNYSSINEKNFSIIVYGQNKKIKKILVEIDNVQVSIEKQNTNGIISYSVAKQEKDNEDNKITVKAEYTGLESIQSVKENYELEIQYESDSTFKYKFNNETKFTDSVDVDDFSTQNSVILTNYKQAQVEKYLTQVGERLNTVNKKQMEELGLKENENPIIYMIPSLYIYSSALSTINTSEVSNQEIIAFNNKFEIYESTNLQGVTVKGLLSTIALNNESQDNNRKIKEINFNGEEYETTEQNLTFMKEDIDTQKSYRVEFEKDKNTGIIYRAVINEK